MARQSRKERFLELTEGLWEDNRCVISVESHLRQLSLLAKKYKTESISDTLTIVLGLAFSGEELELESEENKSKPDSPPPTSNHKKFHLEDGY